MITRIYKILQKLGILPAVVKMYCTVYVSTYVCTSIRHYQFTVTICFTLQTWLCGCRCSKGIATPSTLKLISAHKTIAVRLRQKKTMTDTGDRDEKVGLPWLFPLCNTLDGSLPPSPSQLISILSGESTLTAISCLKVYGILHHITSFFSYLTCFSR